jgi:hypothetical protein
MKTLNSVSSASSVAIGLGAGLLTLGASSARAEPAEWFLQTGSVSHHFSETQAPGRRWNEQHPGLGLERRAIDDDGWQVRWTGGVMQDSRSFWGGYAGAAYMSRWRIGGGQEISAGAGAYAFYRSTSWSGRMTVVPAVLPTVSIGLLENRLGMNFTFVPRIPALRESMPAVLLAQVVLRVP